MTAAELAQQSVHAGDLVEVSLTPSSATAGREIGQSRELRLAPELAGVAAAVAQGLVEQLADVAQVAVGGRAAGPRCRI